MGKKMIPDEIREQVTAIVKKFNREEIKVPNTAYIARFQGRFLYLDRIIYDKKEPLVRMEYFREINEWDFAIFRWSSETYDPDPFMFPGYELFDGTIEGAMRAGMKAYPV
jgi:hypothetical protein